MSKRAKKICIILMIVGLIPIFFDFRLTVGFELGCIVSILLYWRNDLYWNDVVDGGESHLGKGMLHFIVNYALMALVMILGVIFPQYTNIYTAALGLALIKIAVVINEIVPGKEEGSE